MGTPNQKIPRELPGLDREKPAMDKILDQQEIDAIVRLARGPETAAPSPAATAWDLRKAGQIGSEQLRSINLFHEAFARDLSHSLAAYLRIAFHVVLVSAEHLTYREFLKSIPDSVYLASCKLKPMGGLVLFQLDLAIAFPLIDVLLGGEGNSTLAAREITEIEEQILETVMVIICRELQNSWKPLSLAFEFEGRQPSDQMQHLLPSDEKVLSLSFEITLAECRGTLTLAVPAMASHALMRKISVPRARAQARPTPDSNVRLRNRLLRCPFATDLIIKIEGVSVSQLMQLSPGNLLILRRWAEQPATLAVQDCEIFSATVARRNTMRAAQLLGPSPQPELQRRQS
jgi:flagellar motor switch protein FliM